MKKRFPTDIVVKYVGILTYIFHLYGGFVGLLGKGAYLSTTFGYTVITVAGTIVCTYSRTGRLYFSNYFRIMQYLLLFTVIGRQLYFLYLFKHYQTLNASIYTISLSIIVFVLGAIAGTKKQK